MGKPVVVHKPQQRASSKKVGHRHHAISTDIVNYLKEELLQTWDSFLIPDYHRTVFLDCIYGLSPTQYSPIIAKEIEDLQQEKAPIQNAIRSIIARESCVNQVRVLDKVLEEAEMVGSLSPQMLDECVNILHSLRMLSLHVVKCVIDWRKQLIYNYLMANQTLSGEGAKFKQIPFIWEGENYLIKVIPPHT